MAASLEVADNSHLPNCHSCRKQSDGAKTIGTTVLCGTCYDRFLTSREGDAVAWAARMRATTFKACWDAVPIPRAF